MAQHTPGPWMAAASPSSIVGWPIVAAQGRSIANASWMPKPPHVSEDEYASFQREVGANARLIAAAPELLEALEALAARFSRVSDVGNGGLHNQIEAARAAIAKAKGGAA